MASIVLHEIGYKNFLSSGNVYTIIKIDVAPTTLIIGQNGGGKTTISDCICFAWFNRALRNINKTQLVNSVNNSNTEVYTLFSIGETKYKITRGIKPNTLEILINGNPLELVSGKEPQEWIEDLLGFSYKTCKHVILLGNASYLPFMQMNAADRRLLVEDLRELDVFAAMTKIAKAELDTLNKHKVGAESDHKLFSNKVEMLKQFIDESEKNTNNQKADIQKSIDNMMSEIEAKRTTRALLVTEGTTLSKTIPVVYEAIEQEFVKLRLERDQAQLKKSNLEKTLDNFSSLVKCPTCYSEVSHEHKDNIQEQIDNSILKLSSGLALITKAIDEKQLIVDSVNKTKNTLDELRTKIKEIDSEVNSIKQSIERSNNTLNTIDKSNEGIENRKKELKETQLQVISSFGEIQSRSEEISILEECLRHLKDNGIKASLIDEFIPIFNSLVNKYLDMMDFFVRFELDKEFNETIKSRHRDDFSYYSFSEGEKQTIDLALLFAWRELTMLSGNALCNVLVLDEIFDSSLDANVTELVLDILEKIGDKSNIFVISHKPPETFDNFDRVIMFEKKNGFSVMKELN